MQDFTLVIPTHNRPKPLAALLKYLGAEQPPCRILVPDSSQPQPRAATRKIFDVATSTERDASLRQDSCPVSTAVSAA
jgi:hypothetical protein